MTDGAGDSGLRVDADFPGGNIVVERVEGDHIYVRQDERDTTTWWFYWCFRVRGASGRTLSVHFTKGDVIGARGPAVSTDGGADWRWLGTETVAGESFEFLVPDDVEDMRFCLAFPYLEENLRQFLARVGSHPNLAVEPLCKTAKGRSVESLRVGRIDGQARLRALLTARHHCCEMMASYALEGLVEAVLMDPADGAWLRENVEFLVVPFVDKDGVEDGDQGKNRAPRDHNRDYEGESVHAAPRALRALVPVWADAGLAFALDLHCPYIKGGMNESLYFVGLDCSRQWEALTEFSHVLATVQEGPIVLDAANNLPFGESWNTAENYTGGKSFARWACEQPGIKLAATLEIPYANADGTDVTGESARALGHDLAKTIRGFLDR